jgi:DNA-binding NtrC family response regulator
VPEGVWPESGQEQIVGQSPALKQVLALAERLAPSDAAVLIAGEPRRERSQSPEPSIA